MELRHATIALMVVCVGGDESAEAGMCHFKLCYALCAAFSPCVYDCRGLEFVRDCERLELVIMMSIDVLYRACIQFAGIASMRK